MTSVVILKVFDAFFCDDTERSFIYGLFECRICNNRAWVVRIMTLDRTGEMELQSLQVDAAVEVGSLKCQIFCFWLQRQLL